MNESMIQFFEKDVLDTFSDSNEPDKKKRFKLLKIIKPKTIGYLVPMRKRLI